MKTYEWKFGALGGRINAPNTKAAKVTLIAALKEAGAAKVSKKLPKGTTLTKIGLTKGEATGKVAVLAGVDNSNADAGAKASKAAIKRAHKDAPAVMASELWFNEMKKDTSFSNCKLVFKDGSFHIVCDDNEYIVKKGTLVCKLPL
jgi:hypothetical protein